MVKWKRDIREVARDFYLSKSDIQQIFKKVEQLYSEKEMPSFYKGNRDEYLYDQAQREMMTLIYA